MNDEESLAGGPISHLGVLQSLWIVPLLFVFAATANAAPGDREFEITVASIGFGSNIAGTSGGVGWSACNVHVTRAITNNVSQAFSNGAAFDPPIAGADAFHLGGSDYPLTFDQEIDSIVFYMREVGGSASFDIGPGLTPEIVSGGGNLLITGTRVSTTPAGGAVRYSGLNSNTLFLDNGPFDGMEIAWYVESVTGGAGGDLSCDLDGDGVNDDVDNCPNDANASQEDLDGDLLGDACDSDADGDGDLFGSDCDDLDPTRYMGAIEICTDGVDNDCDTQVDELDAGGDCDGDGVPNEDDNCPLAANALQENLDGDGQGDVCDDDIDGDGVLNGDDNCPVNANELQADLDGDGAGDACDADADGDGLDDQNGDLCLDSTTTDPDAGVPSRGLGKNRWANIDGNAEFDTSGNNPTGRSFTIADTAGCNCAQIIELCGYGNGHTKFGCSNSVMDWWTGKHERVGEPLYQCKD